MSNNDEKLEIEVEDDAPEVVKTENEVEGIVKMLARPEFESENNADPMLVLDHPDA
jgi:hypothetical protein